MEGRGVGDWVSKKRRVEDSLVDAQKTRLEAIPGWTWSEAEKDHVRRSSDLTQTLAYSVIACMVHQRLAQGLLTLLGEERTELSLMPVVHEQLSQGSGGRLRVRRGP